MSARQGWRSRFCGVAPDLRLRGWLTEPGSLTARCQKSCAAFRVRLLGQGKSGKLADEPGAGGLTEVREVLLLCDDVPVIFARSTLVSCRPGRLARWLAGLGSRSLGTLLFSYPGFRRTPIEYLKLDARHPLFQRAAPFAGGASVLWARRSRHRLGNEEVRVTEVFLPAISGLSPVDSNSPNGVSHRLTPPDLTA